MTLQEQLQSRPKRATKYPQHLTAREVAVLQLIATGKTNREISGQLCISLRTVATHVTHIFNKIVVCQPGRGRRLRYPARAGVALRAAFSCRCDEIFSPIVNSYDALLWR